MAVVLQRIIDAATVMVEDYAPDAPEALQNEAMVRLASWLYDQDPTAASPGGAVALRASGAGPILNPYRVHRGG